MIPFLRRTWVRLVGALRNELLRFLLPHPGYVLEQATVGEDEMIVAAVYRGDRAHALTFAIVAGDALEQAVAPEPLP